MTKAIFLYREVLAKTPFPREEIYVLALALLAQGKCDDAIQAYQQALSIICSAKGVVKRALMDLALLERAATSTTGQLEVKNFSMMLWRKMTIDSF